MKTRIALTIVAVTLAACATPSTMFVGPDGKVARCSASGWGYVGAPMAQSIHSNCLTDLKATGMLPLAEAGAIGIVASTEPSSLRILKVNPGSPADVGGIKSGDSIVAVDDQTVSNWADARRLLFGRANTPVKVTYRSSGSDKTTTLTRYPYSNMQEGMQK